MEKTYLVILIVFVSVTLAEEDRNAFSGTNLPGNPTNVSEDSLRAAGISIPSWEEIRESFRKFQEQLNKIRAYSGFNANSTTPTSNNVISNSTNPHYSTISNVYRPRGDNLGRDSFPGDEVETVSVSHSKSKLNPPDSDYPPGFIRRPNPYFPTTSTPTLTTSELQRHTTTTIYIICICLVIMVVGSVLFMCVGKCQENGQAPNNVTSTSRRNSRISNRNSRATGSTTVSIVIPSESRGSRGGAASSIAGSSTTSIPGANIEYDAKFVHELPPSYESLFPNGKSS